MARTLAEVETALAAVNSQLEAIVADLDAKGLSYSLEGLRIDRAATLRELRQLKKDLEDERNSFPSFEETVLDEPNL